MTQVLPPIADASELSVAGKLGLGIAFVIHALLNAAWLTFAAEESRLLAAAAVVGIAAAAVTCWRPRAAIAVAILQGVAMTSAVSLRLDADMGKLHGGEVILMMVIGAWLVDVLVLASVSSLLFIRRRKVTPAEPSARP